MNNDKTVVRKNFHRLHIIRIALQGIEILKYAPAWPEIIVFLDEGKLRTVFFDESLKLAVYKQDLRFTVSQINARLRR